MKVNTNVQATVILTAFGARHFNQYMATFHGVRFNTLQAGESLKAELWNIMAIFGSTIYNGMAEVPFQDNEMEIHHE